MTRLKEKTIGRLKRAAIDLAGRWPSSPNEGHQFDTAAFLAAVLNDILAFITCGLTFLQPHRPPADDAGYQCEQRAAVIIHERATSWTRIFAKHSFLHFYSTAAPAG